MYKHADGTPIPDIQQGVSVNDVQYPWPLSEERLQELGIYWEADPVRADDRFYWNGDLNTPKPLQDVANYFWEQRIKPHRDSLQEAGCKVSGDWFHNDVKSRTQWERMANKCEKLGLADADQYLIAGTAVPWKTMSGDFVVLTAGKIREVVDTFEAYEATIFAKAEQCKATVAGMPTVEQMIAYDWKSGWPESFAEEQARLAAE